MVLPRIVMEKEWIDDVEWNIVLDDKSILTHQMSVFGDNGRRYIQMIDVPVSPSAKYMITLIDKESLDGDEILKWEIDGIGHDRAVFFNANGRMTTPNYLLMPYGIIVMADGAKICDTKHITTFRQSYPTDKAGYSILVLQPDSRDSEMSFWANGVLKTIKMRPQINMYFEGKRLFSLGDEKYQIFTDIPQLLIEIDDRVGPEGLNVRMGKAVTGIDRLFVESVAGLNLRKHFQEQIKGYGTYSLRLYQYDRFLRQIEFSYVPGIKSNYTPFMKWPDMVRRRETKVFKFERLNGWTLEFDSCIVKSDEENYTVECPSDICQIKGMLSKEEEDNFFCCCFDLPVSPFSVKILDSSGQPVEEVTDRATKLSLSDINTLEYWVTFECFGKYKEYDYSLVLRSANGIEQTEKFRLSYNGSSNINLACFYDTLRNCPLPAQIELKCVDNEERFLPLLVVSDTLELSVRPKLIRQEKRDYISVALEDGDKDLLIKKYGRIPEKYEVSVNKAQLNKKGDKKGYALANRLADGLYTVESVSEDHVFLFEDESNIEITNGRNVMYVSSRKEAAPIGTFSDWLDQLKLSQIVGL